MFFAANNILLIFSSAYHGSNVLCMVSRGAYHLAKKPPEISVESQMEQ